MFYSTVNPIVLAAPAKLNLFLAVTGRRTDGFHDLVSLVTPVDWGDTLTVESAVDFTVTCDDPALACDETNLVLRAARAFAAAAGWPGGARFSLKNASPWVPAWAGEQRCGGGADGAEPSCGQSIDSGGPGGGCGRGGFGLSLVSPRQSGRDARSG
jgi:4-diphosphocytidyl-2-C-methyl-D-erythritol kinase